MRPISKLPTLRNIRVPYLFNPSPALLRHMLCPARTPSSTVCHPARSPFSKIRNQDLPLGFDLVWSARRDASSRSCTIASMIASVGGGAKGACGGAGVNGRVGSGGVYGGGSGVLPAGIFLPLCQRRLCKRERLACRRRAHSRRSASSCARTARSGPRSLTRSSLMSEPTVGKRGLCARGVVESEDVVCSALRSETRPPRGECGFCGRNVARSCTFSSAKSIVPD